MKRETETVQDLQTRILDTIRREKQRTHEAYRQLIRDLAAGRTPDGIPAILAAAGRSAEDAAREAAKIVRIPQLREVAAGLTAALARRTECTDRQTALGASHEAMEAQYEAEREKISREWYNADTDVSLARSAAAELARLEAEIGGYRDRRDFDWGEQYAVEEYARRRAAAGLSAD